MAGRDGRRALGWAVVAALVFPVSAMLYEAVALRAWPRSDVPGGRATDLALGGVAVAVSLAAAWRALSTPGRDADTRIGRGLAALVLVGWLTIVAVTGVNLLTGPPSDPACAIPILVCG